MSLQPLPNNYFFRIFLAVSTILILSSFLTGRVLAMPAECIRWAPVGTPIDGSPTMTYDSKRGVVVLFGGQTRDQTWEWDGSQWKLKASTGPSPRYSIQPWLMIPSVK